VDVLLRLRSHLHLILPRERHQLLPRAVVQSVLSIRLWVGWFIVHKVLDVSDEIITVSLVFKEASGTYFLVLRVCLLVGCLFSYRGKMEYFL
jgi:hypothetical protein